MGCDGPVIFEPKPFVLQVTNFTSALRVVFAEKQLDFVAADPIFLACFGQVHAAILFCKCTRACSGTTKQNENRCNFSCMPQEASCRTSGNERCLHCLMIKLLLVPTNMIMTCIIGPIQLQDQYMKFNCCSCILTLSLAGVSREEPADDRAKEPGE
jgi:hypothetical protein